MIILDDGIEYVEDADLLVAVRDIFGDIVVKAEREKGNEVYAEKTSIQFNSYHLRLTFQDGRVVEFWNSEWGGIKRVDDLSLPPPADQWQITDEQIAEAKQKPPLVINKIPMQARGLLNEN